MRATGCNPYWYSPFAGGPAPVSVGGVLVCIPKVTIFSWIDTGSSFKDPRISLRLSHLRWIVWIFVGGQASTLDGWEVCLYTITPSLHQKQGCGYVMLSWVQVNVFITLTKGLGETTRTLVPWRQVFRHLTRNECMGWFAQTLPKGTANR